MGNSSHRLKTSGFPCQKYMKKGLTLVDIMIVVASIGLIVAIFLPLLINHIPAMREYKPREGEAIKIKLTDVEAKFLRMEGTHYIVRYTDNTGAIHTENFRKDDLELPEYSSGDRPAHPGSGRNPYE